MLANIALELETSSSNFASKDRGRASQRAVKGRCMSRFTTKCFFDSFCCCGREEGRGKNGGADTKQHLLGVWMQYVNSCLGCVTRWKKMMAGGRQADLRPFVLKIKLSCLAQDLSLFEVDLNTAENTTTNGRNETMKIANRLGGNPSRHW